jgi:predicted RND superfamily exporter protein
MKDKIIKYRSIIVIAATIITLLSLLLIPRLQVNANVDDYVPDTIKNKIYLKELDSIFGGSEMILLMLHSEDVVNAETLNRLESLATDLDTLKGLDRVISPFSAQEISIQDGMMSMTPFFEEIPDNQADFEALKKRIALNSMTNRFFS